MRARGRQGREAAALCAHVLPARQRAQQQQQQQEPEQAASPVSVAMVLLKPYR